MTKETSFHKLIHDYDEQSKLWQDLSIEQRNELVAVWLQCDCPGVPSSGADYFDDAIVSNNELRAPVLNRMAGHDNSWSSISEKLFWGIREHCANDVVEVWEEIKYRERAA